MHELDTKIYIFTRRRKLVDLSKDKNKIDGLLLLADGIGKTMEGEAHEEGLQITDVEHKALGLMASFPAKLVSMVCTVVEA